MSEDTIPDELWREFAKLRLEEGNLNDHLDLPAILGFLQDGFGKVALDLGCGLGQSSFKLAEMLHYSVVAVDKSYEMLTQAKRLYSGSGITWVESGFDVLSFNNESFDLITSCLSFHFVSDLAGLIQKCASWLKRGGLLVFSVRHPVRTCNPLGERSDNDGWSWLARDYASEGPRTFKWLGVECVNYHRTISTYVRILREAGLNLEALDEPMSTDPSLSFSAESRSVPFCVTIAARKQN